MFERIRWISCNEDEESEISEVPVSSLPDPMFWIFSHPSLILVKPRVADEPFKKWPNWESVWSSLLELIGRDVSFLPMKCTGSYGFSF